ncbi:MAG: PD-(D/E)XK nuclease family protein [Deltaproteobacteria bacterium]|nr:MAG: PD-(D/E)XK nuclease family protein [Deltaproteobacteria bacterium]
MLVLGPSWEACDDLVRAATAATGARFGSVRLTLDRLAVRLATPALARDQRTPATALSLSAVAARAVHLVLGERGLGYFTPVADRPGFPLAVARTLAELRMNRVAPEALAALGAVGRDLGELAGRVARELEEARLADRAIVFEAAVAAVGADPPPHPVGLPLLLLDLPVTSACEAQLIAMLASSAPDVLATAPAGDGRSLERLEAALGCIASTLDAPRRRSSLDALKAHLFELGEPPPAAVDGSVALSSWPGEARECVEIARGVQGEAARGVPFDRMAVLLRSPAEYRSHLEEAFRRAAIPVFFARGTTRPDPAGRALLALLACKTERLSARRFAEYVSLAQVPDPGAAEDADARWTPPEDDLLPLPPATEPRADDERGDGSPRAPWRWERLLVEASVIGGKERWAKRLAGLEEELRLRREALTDEEEETRGTALERQLADLAYLRGFALPLIERLDALPRQARWDEWLGHLRALATAALREPEGVLATLAELEPMAPIGPIDLDEVQLVLRPRLRELTVPPARRRYGAVFVAPAEGVRGLAFDVVFVPSLAEKLFPRKIVEDPILLDAHRRALDAPALATQPARVAAERLALRLAVGAARERVVLSWPRVDIEQARPRVPSFYGLEALRAASGTLPGFDELDERGGEKTGGRLGWPAPARPEDAIDEAEYDLALLAGLRDADPATTDGSARYLLDANVHLGRALRARGRRWLRRWTPADGLVDPDDLARGALADHQLAARPFSPTALQHFAVCPYRFFLQAVMRLQPREEPVALEALDPLTRGALFHEVQFAVLSELRAAQLLPVRPANLDAARTAVDGALDAVAARWADKLWPAIDRVWKDGIDGIRADLREWLRRAADADDGWVPWRFELAFGLADRDRPQADPASVPDPVPVIGDLRLRGSVDLVERHARGVLRATDHKTGKTRPRAGVVVGGGAVLQPLLYALACERLLAEPVEAGRLYYCTADGGYEERVVPLDAENRRLAGEVVEIIGRALAAGFLPAMPERRACQYCDYRPVCGPHEETRTARKPKDRCADLDRLRRLP